MTRMEKYIRDHPFFAQQSVFKFTTTQRRAFERDIYDHARGLNYSKANARKQVVTARHLCGEKDHDSDDSRLGSEIDDSEAVLTRKPAHVADQVCEVPYEASTKKRKLELTKDGASAEDGPRKKNKKGKSYNRAETANELISTTLLSLSNEPAQDERIKDLRIRVVVSVVTAMVEIIERHIGCNCESEGFIRNNPLELDNKHGEQSIDPPLTKTQWLYLRKKLLRPSTSAGLRNDIKRQKVVMDLIKNEGDSRSKLMMAWRGALSHGAITKYERSFHDAIRSPDDFDEILRLAGLNAVENHEPADAGTLKGVDDPAQAERSTGMTQVSHEFPDEEPREKQKRRKRAKKVRAPSDDTNSEESVLMDPAIEASNSIGVHKVQQASLSMANTRSSTSAVVGLPQNGSIDSEEARARAEKAIAKAARAEKKARRKERRERDRLKLMEASTNAGNTKKEFVSHNQEDEFSDLGGIIDGLHSASLKPDEPQDIMEKPPGPTTQQAHPENDPSTGTAYQGNLHPKPREIIELSSNSPSPPTVQEKKWTKEQKHKALQADSWLMYTGERADGFPNRLEATFKDLEHMKGFKFTHEEQLRIQDMLQANYGDSYSGSDLQDRILDRIATTQSRDEMIPPMPKKAKGKEKEKSRAKSISRKSDFQSPMIW